MTLLRRLHERIFARAYDCVLSRHEAYVAERKRPLLGKLHGTVLEIGPGTGPNLAYYRQGTRWIGLEPNRYMHARLRDRARRFGITVELHVAPAEKIGLEDASVDAVVSTLVLCSVENPQAVLREIRRVLRPQGRFVFLEHVAAPPGTALRRVQGLARPLWRWFACGCTLDRDLEEALRKSGFSAVELERFRVPWTAVAPLVAPHLIGVAVR